MLNTQTQQQVLSQYGLDANGLLLQDKPPLSDLCVVRHLPNRRLVCRAKWGDEAVYVKLFFGQNYSRYAKRDKAGAQYLAKAKLLTPSLLFAGNLPSDTGAILIFEGIENAENAEVQWMPLAGISRFKLAGLLVKTLAQHHQAGLLQTDLHLKNFLVKDEKIYTLDGDGVRKYTRLSQQQAFNNLSVLLSKFNALETESWLADLLQTYALARGLQTLPDAVWFKQTINAHRQKTASHYADKKVFRQCGDVSITTKSTALQGIFYAASSHVAINIPNSIAELEALIRPDNLLKNGNTCTVALAEIDNIKVVIKRYNIKSFWHGIKLKLRQTRAAKSWANAHRLKLLDIATAKPIAFYEQRTFGLRGKAYFLAEYIDAPDVAEYFSGRQNKTVQNTIWHKKQRAEAVKNIATLFYKLYLLQISHGDMKASNIKVLNNKPVLIDLDSMRQHKNVDTSSAAHIKDLNRFMQNWHKQPALYNAFVKTFKVIYPDMSVLTKAGIAENKKTSRKISHKEISS